MNGLRKLHAAIPIDSPLVERPFEGAAPTAFRIWQAGENLADDGAIYFTRASAKKLLAEQDARGRLYPSDFDHLSLLKNRPATAGRASGWHRLEVRPDANGEPELWAVEIEWCEDVRAGLEKKPPEWRYFSPAFDVDTKTQEVVSYVNFALCINPLTHDLPSLAAHQGFTPMNKEELKAMYAKMRAAETTPEEREAAHRAIAAHIDALPANGGIGDTGGENHTPPEGGLGESPPEGSKLLKDAEGNELKPGSPGYDEALEKHKAKKAAEGGKDDPGNTWPSSTEPQRPAKPPKATETEARAATIDVAKIVIEQGKELEGIKVERLLEKHPSLPASLRTWAATQPLSVVEGMLKATPTMQTRQASVTQGAEGGRTPGLQGAELEELNKHMGIGRGPKTQFEHVPATDGGGLRIHAIRPSDARRLASAGK